MIYKLYRCRNRYDSRPGKLTFLNSDPNFNNLHLQATIEADILLRWTQSGSISYGYRSPSGEPVFAISSHNPPPKTP